MNVPKRAAPKVLNRGLGAELASDMATSVECKRRYEGRDTRKGCSAVKSHPFNIILGRLISGPDEQATLFVPTGVQGYASVQQLFQEPTVVRASYTKGAEWTLGAGVWGLEH
jgi:hypothetical protein